jgi:hypothetical protein
MDKPAPADHTMGREWRRNRSGAWADASSRMPRAVRHTVARATRWWGRRGTCCRYRRCGTPGDGDRSDSPSDRARGAAGGASSYRLRGPPDCSRSSARPRAGSWACPCARPRGPGSSTRAGSPALAHVWRRQAHARASGSVVPQCRGSADLAVTLACPRTTGLGCGQGPRPRRSVPRRGGTLAILRSAATPHQG